MRWSGLILTCIFFLSGLLTFPLSEGTNRENEIASSSDVPETHVVIQPDNEESVESNQLVNRGDYYSFENHSLLPAWDFTESSYYSLSPSGQGPPLVVEGNMAYLAFIRRNTWFNYSFMVSFSTNKGYTWSVPIKVGDAWNHLNATCSLEKFRGKFYYFMATINMSGRGSLKVLASSTINDLPRITPKNLSNNFSGSQLLSVSTSNALLLLWKEKNSTLYLARNTGNIWNVRSILNGVAFFTAVHFGGKVLLYYTTPGGGEVKMISTTNDGIDWTAPSTVLSLGREINQISVASDGERLHMVTNYKKAPLVVMYSRSTDGQNWESPRAIATYSMNYQDPFDDLSISVRERKVTVAYENSSGRISLVNSTDSGNTWIMGPSFGDTHAHSPTLHPAGDYLLYCEGEHLNVCLIDRYQYTSYVKTKPLRIPALNALEDVAVYSPDFRGEISIRVLGPSGDKIYPTDGDWATMNRTSGIVEGMAISHICHLSIHVPPETSVEFNFTRSGPYNPHIYRLIVNYSTSFPFIYEFDDDLFIVGRHNTSISAGRLHLLPGRSKGSSVIGPVAPDGEWPPFFKISVSGIVGNDKVVVKLLDKEFDPIYGFSEDFANSTVSENGVKILSWKGGFLDDLPGYYTIYLLIEIIRDSGDPSIGNISIIYSSPPKVSAFISDNTTVNRTKSLKITALLTDDDDPPAELKVMFRCVDPQMVERDYLSPPFYSSGTWNTIFTPPKDAPTGTYNIYVKAEDPHGNSSGWIPLPGGILVMNFLPTTPGINVFPEKPRGGDSITVTVVKPSTDIETAEENITYTYRFFKNGQLLKEFVEVSSRSVTLPGGLIKKHDLLKIVVTAYDGENESYPAIFLATIENSPPSSQNPPDSITIEEDGPGYTISLSSIFNDLDGDSIQYTATTTEGLNVNITGDTLYLTPDEDFYGDGNVSIIATDGEDSTTLVIPVSVTPVNDPPEWVPLTDKSVVQDQWLTVIINSWDRDGETLTVENNIMNTIPGLVEGENYILYPNGSFKIKPDNSMIGSYRIVVTFSDSSVTLHDSFTLVILNRDDPPIPPKIETSLSGKYVSAGVSFTLYANCTDPDEIWGQHLTFLWTSSIEGPLGEGKIINVTLKKSGVHIINLTVSDGNHTLRASITISVIGKTVHPAPKGRTLIFISAGVISFLIGFGLAFLLYKRWFSEKKEKEIEEKPSETGPEPE
ncbi:MAG: hypothetical protein J7L88_05710, partial [Thermoplasmata archaeon]|nr:hypothetical protein [Thermoplasmata archaeon]